MGIMNLAVTKSNKSKKPMPSSVTLRHGPKESEQAVAHTIAQSATTTAACGRVRRLFSCNSAVTISCIEMALVSAATRSNM